MKYISNFLNAKKYLKEQIKLTILLVDYNIFLSLKTMNSMSQQQILQKILQDKEKEINQKREQIQKFKQQQALILKEKQAQLDQKNQQLKIKQNQLLQMNKNITSQRLKSQQIKLFLDQSIKHLTNMQKQLQNKFSIQSETISKLHQQINQYQQKQSTNKQNLIQLQVFRKEKLKNQKILQQRLQNAQNHIKLVQYSTKNGNYDCSKKASIKTVLKHVVDIVINDFSLIKLQQFQQKVIGELLQKNSDIKNILSIFRKKCQKNKKQQEFKSAVKNIDIDNHLSTHKIIKQYNEITSKSLKSKCKELLQILGMKMLAYINFQNKQKQVQLISKVPVEFISEDIRKTILQVHQSDRKKYFKLQQTIKSLSNELQVKQNQKLKQISNLKAQIQKLLIELKFQKEQKMIINSKLLQNNQNKKKRLAIEQLKYQLQTLKLKEKQREEQKQKVHNQKEKQKEEKSKSYLIQRSRQSSTLIPRKSLQFRQFRQYDDLYKSEKNRQSTQNKLQNQINRSSKKFSMIKQQNQ